MRDESWGEQADKPMRAAFSGECYLGGVEAGWESNERQTGREQLQLARGEGESQGVRESHEGHRGRRTRQG